MKILCALDPDKASLIRLLKNAKKAYYNTGVFYKATKQEVAPGLLEIFRKHASKGEVTDLVYDALEERLAQIDPSHPLLKSVGVAPKKKKIKLPFRMPSLDKRKGGASDDWLAANPGPYVVSDKVDGVSLGVDYDGRGGTLAFTRGDGQTGGDISFMARDLGLPTLKQALQVRGEVVMPLAKFNAVWAEHFANPRNMVSGITNRNSLHDALAHCKVYMYELVKPRMKPSAGLAKMKSLGFKVVPYKTFDSLDSVKLGKLLDARKGAAQYEMDGLVVAQDIKTPAASGNPTHTVAFKNDAQDDSAVTTVVEVQWRPTRTGALFPRVVIEPVKLKGVTVTYCSGKSAAIIRDLGIGPGARIKIARSGDVIPDIRGVIKATRPQMPSKTVVGDWRWQGDNLQLVDHDAKSATSDSVAVQRMAFFLSTLGVERLKGATLQKFADAGIRNITALLGLRKSEFLGIPDTSEKVLTAVWNQLQTSIKDVELHVLMYASGEFGKNFGSRRLAAIIKDIPDVLAWDQSMSALVEAVDAVAGFDLKTAQQFAKQLPVFRRWLKTVPMVTYTKPRQIRRTGNALANQRIVMTGFRDAGLQTIIEAQGGTIIDSVKKATILLAKDPNGNSSKIGTARGLNIPIMTADAFRRKFSL